MNKMCENNHVSNTTDKEFNNTMFEIFNNTDASVVHKKLWVLYDGDLDGCEQWMAYCKYHNYFLFSRKMSDKECIDTWNGFRENYASVVVKSTDEYNRTDTYKRFSRVEKKSGVLKEVKYMLFLSCDENEYQYYEEKEMR